MLGDVSAWSYDQWLRFLFDHEASEFDGDGWYLDAGEYVVTDPHKLLDHLSRFFCDPTSAVKPYTDLQLEGGLWFLTGHDGFLRYLFDERADSRVRAHTASHMYDLFVELLCDRGRWLTATYMWWANFIAFGGMHDNWIGADALLRNTTFDVLAKLLRVKSDACVKSALHGLNHLQPIDELRVRRETDQFLMTTKDLTQEMREYAEECREGWAL